MFENPKGALMGHGTFQPLDNSRDQHLYFVSLEDSNVDARHTLGVDSICNQVWRFTLCNLHWLWQPDQLHQLLLELVKDLLHWLLNDLKARQVKDQFGN
jgi:hypothetical protein